MLQLEVPKRTPLQGQILWEMLGLQHLVDWVDLVSQILGACLTPCLMLIHWIRLCKILLSRKWCRASFPVLSTWIRYLLLLSGVIMLRRKISGFLTSLYHQILGLNPQLRGILDSSPQLREMMQNPEFLRQLTSPETMQVWSRALWNRNSYAIASLSLLPSFQVQLCKCSDYSGMNCRIIIWVVLLLAFWMMIFMFEVENCIFQLFLFYTLDWQANDSSAFVIGLFIFLTLVCSLCSNFRLCSNLFCPSLVVNNQASKWAISISWFGQLASTVLCFICYY